MASIRRTLSPVPRAGTAGNEEVVSIGSPLSRSSLNPENRSPSSRSLPSSVNSTYSNALLLGLFSKRYFRHMERSKQKGHLWRKVVLHFFICFMIGVSIGVTPFASMLSMNLISKNQASSFEAISALGNSQSFENFKARMKLPDYRELKTDATLDSVVKMQNAVAGMVEEIGKEQNIKAVLDAYNATNKTVNEESHVSQKLLIIVTPTYSHTFQSYYLNRLGQTLKLVSPPLLWIVVEMTSQSAETANLLRRTGIMYRHLICDKNLTDAKFRSTYLRNTALSHIETHHLDGIVHFADEDNSYSVELFQHMREISRFGTWTVAQLTGDRSRTILQGPICNGTRVIGWHVNEPDKRYRRFHAEMSGFAFNSTILWDPKRWHRPTLQPVRLLETVKDGFQVSAFIEQIIEDESQMEGLLDSCTKIMVWQYIGSSNDFHTQKWFANTNLDVILPLM